MLFTPVILASISLLPSVLGAASSLLHITENFGPNPTGDGFFLYVPKKLQKNPPILVDIHACHNNVTNAFTGSQIATLADTHGYLVIYPNSPNMADNCWDVSSTQTLSHNGGGDSLGIVSMVKWTLAKYHGNPDRVFSFGVSSGAMMTEVLLGSYPDVFAAGSAWASIAFGMFEANLTDVDVGSDLILRYYHVSDRCFAGDGFDVWSNACATGQIDLNGEQWAAKVFAAFPGYTGFRPKLQTFHGLIDTVLYPQNLQQEINEWTTVFGLSSTPVKTLGNTPLDGWTTWVYGDGKQFQATLAQNVTHNIQALESVILDWFGLTCSGTKCFSRTNPGA